MKEPILSREEVDVLWVRRHNGLDTPVSFEDSIYNFAANLESAILEKLCGEPIYQARQLSDEASRWDDVYEATHSACASQPQFYETRIVYALNLSQS